MRKIVTLILISLLLVTSVQAEEYQLREPTVTEYMRFVSENLSCYWQQWETYSRSAWSLCSYVIDTIEANYSGDFEHLPYDLLIGAYNALHPGIDEFAPGNPVLWNAALVMAWLRENAVDLASESQLAFDHLTISVNPRDFNADGVDEYFLIVESSGFATYMVVQLSDDGGYRQVPAGLPYHQDTFQSWYEQNSYLREIAFDDFNADGLPEWFLVFEGAQYWDDYFGSMYLLAWRDDGLQSVVDTWLPYIPFANTNAANLQDTSIEDGFIFKNLDDDPTLELQRVSVEPNNWRCPETHTMVFDWDAEAGLYIQQPNDITFTDTLSCIVAPAESRFWERDYYAAARLYEYALTLPLEESEDGYFQELKQYVQLRLVQSYLLSGQLSSADRLLAQLQGETMRTTLAQTLLDLLLTHRTSEPDTLCIALYNLIEESVYQSFQLIDWDKHFNTQLLLGRNERYTTSGYMPNAANAGCNVPAAVDEILATDIYYVPYEPSSQRQSTALDSLLRMGFAVKHHIHADFNGDGAEDWLIWHEAHIPAVLLMAAEEFEPFALSRVQQLVAYSRYAKVETVALPDGAGTAVVTFLAQANFAPGWGGFNCGDVAMLGRFAIWQSTENGFYTTHSAPWCADRPSVAELFGQEDGRDILYTRNNSNEAVQYFWNETLQQYALPAAQPANSTTEGTVLSNPPIQATPTELSNEDLYHGESQKEYYERLDEQVRNAASVDEALAILDAELNAPYMEYPQALQFWKATILREAGRDAEAVAEYVALYSAAPDNVWGKLAALHFEVISEN
jgi:Tetratrico peptide repeat